MEFRKPTITEQKELEYYLSLDEQNLYITLGQRILFDEQVAHSPKTLLSHGKKWIKEQETKLTQKICVEWGLCEKIKDESLMDKITLATSIGDIIATSFIGVPPLVVSSILLKVGVKKFCNCH